MQDALPQHASPPTRPSASPHADDLARDVDSRLLYRISRELLAPGDDVGTVLDNILTHLAEHLGAKRCMITIVDRDRSEITVESAHGLSRNQMARGRYRLGEGVVGRVVDRGEPALVPSLDGEPRFLDRTGARRHEDLRQIAFVCVPIRSGETCIGALSAEPSIRTEYGLDAELHLMETVAVLIGDAVRRRRDVREEMDALRQDQATIERMHAQQEGAPSILGRSLSMRNMLGMATRVAKSDSTVLIRGESGTGKELVARHIHNHSARSSSAFVAVNCGAMPEHLVESELFGHARGAFTGADRMRRGRFELADGGTLFLDEVGELPAHVQVKLLRVLQDGEIYRVGEEQARRVNVRIVAATHVDLESAMADRRFRPDLFYRLNVFPVEVPPLRDRLTDVPLLAEYFVAKFAKVHGCKVERISAPALEMLMHHRWPGNVRELENAMSRAVIVTPDGVIRRQHLPSALQASAAPAPAREGSLSEMVEAFEREILVGALKRARGNQSEAARALHTTARIFSYRLKKRGIDPDAYR